MDHPDCRTQGTILHRPGTLGPAGPGRIAGGRDRARAAHEPDRIATVVLRDRAVSHRDSFAKHAAARLKKIPLLPEGLVFPFQPCQRILLGPPRLARAALGLHVSRLGPPAGPHRARYPEFPSRLGHRPARFPCEPDRLTFACVGTLTSRDGWPGDLQFHDSPT